MSPVIQELAQSEFELLIELEEFDAEKVEIEEQQWLLEIIRMEEHPWQNSK